MKKLVVLCLALLVMTGCASKPAPSKTNEIHVYTRDSSSGTREAYEKGAKFEKELTQNAIETSSNGDMATRVGQDENGIGYVSLSTDFAANNVVALQYEGISPSEETVLDGSYKLQRPFSYVTRASKDYESAEKEALILAFLDYLSNSKEGMLIVEKAGGVVDTSKAVAWDELAKNHPIVMQDNTQITITTVGSTSVEKSLKAALESFVPMAGNFKFTMTHSGSADGYKRVLGSEKDGANRGDIGFASRLFNDTENTSAALSTGSYCIDAVVSIVQVKNTKFISLTQKQIQDIFKGTALNWEDVK